jgi:hypothetical protein
MSSETPSNRKRWRNGSRQFLRKSAPFPGFEPRRPDHTRVAKPKVLKALPRIFFGVSQVPGNPENEAFSGFRGLRGFHSVTSSRPSSPGDAAPPSPITAVRWVRIGERGCGTRSFPRTQPLLLSQVKIDEARRDAPQSRQPPEPRQRLPFLRRKMRGSGRSSISSSRLRMLTTGEFVQAVRRDSTGTPAARHCACLHAARRPRVATRLELLR